MGKKIGRVKHIIYNMYSRASFEYNKPKKKSQVAAACIVKKVV